MTLLRCCVAFIAALLFLCLLLIPMSNAVALCVIGALIALSYLLPSSASN